MPRYVRAKLKGSVFFFAVVLADRSSRLLVDEFETIAICVLPDHIHAVWAAGTRRLCPPYEAAYFAGSSTET